MIVNQVEQGWDIVFQRAHAILAAQIALGWKVSERPEPWTELVAAIADHDDGQARRRRAGRADRARRER